MVSAVGSSRALLHEGSGPLVGSPEAWGNPSPYPPCSSPPAAQRKRCRKLLVPAVGIEPTWSCPRRILSPLRLPVPPRRPKENLHEPFRSVKKKDRRLNRPERMLAA